MKNLFLDKVIPFPVKFVAGAFLFASVFNFLYFIFYVSVTPIAYLAVVKAIIGLFFAYGLLKLSAGWRIVSLFISCAVFLMLPFYLIAVLISPDFVTFITDTTAIESKLVMIATIIGGFFWALAIFFPLMRPEVIEAFDVQTQESQIA